MSKRQLAIPALVAALGLGVRAKVGRETGGLGAGFKRGLPLSIL